MLLHILVAALTDHLKLSAEQANAYQLYAAGLGKTAIETIAATAA